MNKEENRNIRFYFLLITMCLSFAYINYKLKTILSTQKLTLMEVQLLKAEIETLKENHFDEFETQAL
jgi:hypothetical protein